MKEKFAFLTSTRFWALLVGAFSVYAQTKGWIGEAEMKLIGTLSVGFIGIRTIDRTAEVNAAGK